MLSTENSELGSTAAARTEGQVNRVVRGAHAAIDRLAEKAVPAVERLSGGVNSAAASLRTRAEDLNTLQQRWVESSRRCVRASPLISIATALAVGMILARFLGRRD